MILYWFLINILFLTFRVYFRRIYVINSDNLPKNKPVLLAPNHPNSFIDGVLLSVLLRRKLFIMARGDVFAKPLANWALRSMRVLPIFRKEDGAGHEQTDKNQATYNECYDIFHRNGMVLIFPEGVCVTERRLRPIKKGTAKMAIEAMEKFSDMDLQIVPVGLNYSEPGKFREEVCINFGKAISVRETFKDLSKENQAKKILDFNGHLYESLERELVIIKNPENDKLGHKYLIIVRNHYKPSFWGFIKTTKNRFLVEKRAANDLNDLYEKNPERFSIFQNKIENYFESLSKIKIKEKYFSITFLEKILYAVFTILFFIPALIGFILNFIPVVWAKSIADKKVKKVEFYDSVNIGAGAIFAFLYFSFLFLVLLPFFGFKALFMVIGIRLLGFLYLFWIEAAFNTKYWYTMVLTSKGRNIKASLISQRKFILDFFK